MTNVKSLLIGSAAALVTTGTLGDTNRKQRRAERAKSRKLLKGTKRKAETARS